MKFTGMHEIIIVLFSMLQLCQSINLEAINAFLQEQRQYCGQVADKSGQHIISKLCGINNDSEVLWSKLIKIDSINRDHFWIAPKRGRPSWAIAWSTVKRLLAAGPWPWWTPPWASPSAQGPSWAPSMWSLPPPASACQGGSTRGPSRNSALWGTGESEKS